MLMICGEPHKRNHTAAAVSHCEGVLGERLVSGGTSQVTEVAWADELDIAGRVPGDRDDRTNIEDPGDWHAVGTTQGP